MREWSDWPLLVALGRLAESIRNRRKGRAIAGDRDTPGLLTIGPAARRLAQRRA